MEEEKKGEELKSEGEQPEPAEAIEETKAEEEAEEISEEKEAVGEAAETEVEEAPKPVEEEEAKPPPREEKAEEEEIVEERIYTIPLGKAWVMPPNKRAPKAMRIIRNFVTRHMKLEAKKEGEEEEVPGRLIITNEVNERIWRRGIEKPSRKIRIRAAKDKEGNVTVHLAEGD
jgi:large subunit ribosomal protein L31e